VGASAVRRESMFGNVGIAAARWSSDEFEDGLAYGGQSR